MLLSLCLQVRKTVILCASFLQLCRSRPPAFWYRTFRPALYVSAGIRATLTPSAPTLSSIDRSSLVRASTSRRSKIFLPPNTRYAAWALTPPTNFESLRWTASAAAFRARQQMSQRESSVCKSSFISLLLGSERRFTAHQDYLLASLLNLERPGIIC